ncbi:MbcA/ParS/Xre antitoxin family protein [Marinobacter sp. ATCH36]|uniref:MbcA/ParS/Xre antitoxin family protein n=1 Tax=Marinobacter sp. ATCH36 TaxID=2945106 RepID=UPI002021CCC2|nr:MbcA/ParS/Xre antitoxin family protein [Marinobacter sp. ATCH36]MCL7944658.1 MbcA/ParS/Xre antitoxin family protein [Marinobacter sp. ATCH36]
MAKAQDSATALRDKTIAESLELFEGDEAAAERWLHSPIRGLGYKTPAELIETPEGVDQVRTLIGRLEHGVFT